MATTMKPSSNGTPANSPTHSFGTLGKEWNAATNDLQTLALRDRQSALVVVRGVARALKCLLRQRGVPMKPCLILLVGALLSTAACSKDNPTNPTPPQTPPPPPAPTSVSLSGVVMAVGTNQRIAGATVTFGDGPNVGQFAVTDAGGNYRFPAVTRGNANLSASANGYLTLTRGIFVDNSTLNFSLRTVLPWSQSGAGNTVFVMPSYFDRVRIRGTWNGSGTSNFIVSIGGNLVVNEILRNMPGRTYEGVHLTRGGGQTEITNSSAIAWVFTEER